MKTLLVLVLGLALAAFPHGSAGAIEDPPFESQVLQAQKDLMPAFKLVYEGGKAQASSAKATRTKGIPDAINAAESLAAAQASGVDRKIPLQELSGNTQIGIRTRRGFGGNYYDYIDIEPTVHYEKALAAARREARDARLVKAKAHLWSIVNEKQWWGYIFYSSEKEKTISVWVTSRGKVSTESEKGHPQMPRGRFIDISRIKVSFWEALSIVEDSPEYSGRAPFYVELRPPLAASSHLAYYFFHKTSEMLVGVSAEDGSTIKEME